VAKKSRNRSAGPKRTAAAGAASAGSGVAGTKQLTAPAAAGQTAAYPGKQFGFPERGPGSVSSMPRRVLALFIDWILCLLIAKGLFHSSYLTIAIFAVEVFMLTALGGSSVGKRLCGLRVIRPDGGRVGFGWSLLRTAILLTVIPPLLTDRDLRGLHDRAANTVVVRI